MDSRVQGQQGVLEGEAKWSWRKEGEGHFRKGNQRHRFKKDPNVNDRKNKFSLTGQKVSHKIK